MNDLQQLADSLAAELNRAVFIDDAVFRPLAASAQLGRVDEARVQALLSRSPTKEHLRYFTRCGVINARGPLRVPGSDEHGLLPRLVVPIVADDRVEGRMWFVDVDPPLTQAEIDRAVVVSRQLSALLSDANLAARRRTTRGDQLLHDLERAGARRRQALCAQLRDEFGFDKLDATYTAVVELRSGDTKSRGGVAGPDWLGEARNTFVDLVGVPSVAVQVAGGEFAAIVSTSGSDREVLSVVEGATSRVSALHGLEIVGVGVGTAMLTSDGLGSAMRRARYAARVAGLVPSFDRAARWSALGEYQLFYALPWNLDGVASLHPGVAQLLIDNQDVVVLTLLSYLEREGDVAGTARALNIHRTTLYYRLERAAEAVGGQITGAARLSIHAALRLADLSGLVVES